jgi:hypothetical protein
MVDQKQDAYTITTPIGHEVTVTRLSQKDVEREMAEIEAKYGVSSAEFAAMWNRGDLDCSIRDYFKWVGYCRISYKRGRSELRIED